MGHIRLGTLPRTRKWRQIIELIAGGASAAQLAIATTNAVTKELSSAARDPGVVEAVWLLLRLPIAARADDFADALRGYGLNVSDTPSLMDLAAALSDTIDTRMPNCRGRTDLGEMAQMATIETVTKVVGTRAGNLFGTTPHDVHRALAGLATVKEFGLFAKQFYSRFTFRCLSYLLSKTLPAHIGADKRFRTVADQAAFTAALDTHCCEATIVLLKFSGDWFSKARFQTAGDITRERAQLYVGGAIAKLLKELRNREDGDAE
jgi:hypothetical protein